MARSLESAAVLSTLACICQGSVLVRALSCVDILIFVCAIQSVPPGPLQVWSAVPVNHLGPQLLPAFPVPAARVTIDTVGTLLPILPSSDVGAALLPIVSHVSTRRLACARAFAKRAPG